MISSFRCMPALVGALVASLSAAPAWSQAFPSKAITIVVPYAAGATDREARKIGELASKHLGQPIVIENREGAGGQVGAQYVAQSKPDGYTLLYAAPAVLTVAPLVGKPAYKYDDLMAVARASITPHLLAARADAPFKTLPELIAYAKANPGKVTFGSPGSASAVHLAGEAFADAAGISINHVPYRGLAPAITAALGGFVDIVIGAPGAISTQIEAGKLRAIAQFGSERAAALPDVPTLKENGIDLALRADFGLFAAKGTPRDVVAKIDDAFAQAIQSEDFKAFASQARVAPAFLPAAEYQKVVDAERAVFTRVVPKLSLTTN